MEIYGENFHPAADKKWLTTIMNDKNHSECGLNSAWKHGQEKTSYTACLRR